MEVVKINAKNLLDETFTALALLNKTKSFKDILSVLTGETFLLARLNDLGGKSMPSTLAQHSGFTPSRLSAILKTLQSKNFIERIGNENDKRSILVQLTPLGKTHIETKTQEITEHTSHMLTSLGDNDTKEFIRLIHRIIEIEQNINKSETELN